MIFLQRHFSRVIGAGIVATLGLSARASAAFTPATTYEWDQNLGHVTVMQSVSDGPCFLTGMEGDYVGTSENIHIEDDDNYWVLTGGSEQNSVTGWATCVSQSNFLGSNGYGTEEWSASSNCTPGENYSWPFLPIPTTCYLGTATLWDSTAFCSLSYISGGFDSNTYMETYFNGATWQLRALEQTGGATMNAGATCLGLHNNSELYYDGPYVWIKGQEPVEMLPDTEAICALTDVHGGFAGNGEIVQVLDLNGTWYLWGTSSQDGTSAAASCLYYNQL